MALWFSHVLHCFHNLKSSPLAWATEVGPHMYVYVLQVQYKTQISKPSSMFTTAGPECCASYSEMLFLQR